MKEQTISMLQVSHFFCILLIFTFFHPLFETQSTGTNANYITMVLFSPKHIHLFKNTD